ncbi:MAG: PepSY domain-containing protein [Nitrososphaera sp.]
MSSLGNKKFLITALLAAGLVASLVAVASFASAQNATNPLGNNTGTQGGTIPPATKSNNSTQAATMDNIVGSINVRQAAKTFMSEHLRLTLTDASKAAESQGNGTAVKGSLGVVNDYLVYTITMANMNDGTIHKVIVDAGNGNVLYTSSATPMDHSSLGRMMDGAFHSHHHHHHRHYD